MVEKFYTIDESTHCSLSSNPQWGRRNAKCDFVYSEDEVQTAAFTKYLESHEDYGKKYEDREYFRPANCKTIRERTPPDRRMEVVDGEKSYEHISFEWEEKDGDEPAEAELPSPTGISILLAEEHCKNPNSDAWEIHSRSVEADCIQLTSYELKRWTLEEVLNLLEGPSGAANPSYLRDDSLTKNGFKPEAEIDLVVLCDDVEWEYYTKENNPNNHGCADQFLLPDGKTYREREFVAPGPSWNHDLESQRAKIESILEGVDYGNRDLLITRSSQRGYPFHGNTRARHYDTIFVYSIGDYYTRKQKLREEIIRDREKEIQRNKDLVNLSRAGLSAEEFIKRLRLLEDG